MKSNSYDDDQLEPLLKASYDRLRRSDPDQRGTLLALFSQQRAARLESQAGRPRLSRRAWQVGTFSLATAASILALIGFRLLAPSATGTVYGVEEIGRRMCEVRTIHIRGWQYFYNDRNPADAPIRIPVEYLVKRPDKYRSTWYGVSYGAVVKVKSGTQFCDGQQTASVNDTDKGFFSQVISPLEAMLKTEDRAQLWVATALQSPLTGYKKIGEGHCNGRKCDLYEGQVDKEPGTRRTRLWFDPTTGYPLRLIHDELQPDGSFRPESESEEILVNVPLADDQFRLTVPAGYQRWGTAPQDSDRPPVLGTAPSSGGDSGGIHVEGWNALRIADNVALVVWRRSAPEPAADGAEDWLSHVDWIAGEEASGLKTQHTWLYNSKSPDVWSWSLVVMSGGRWPDPGHISLRVRTDADGQVSLGMLALWFPDAELQRILAAAANVMLPTDIPRPSLESLRAKAKELSDDQVAP